MVSRDADRPVGERRVLASRGISPSRPVLAPDPKPKLSPGFYIGMALAIVFICVLALIGAVTVAVAAALWVKGWGW